MNHSSIGHSIICEILQLPKSILHYDLGLVRKSLVQVSLLRLLPFTANYTGERLWMEMFKLW